MKVGVVGIGAVGRAVAMAMLNRGSCGELVLVDREEKVARSTGLDLRFALPLAPPGLRRVSAGGPDALRDAAVVVIAAGTNEQAGGATDRNDPEGRLKLLDRNAPVLREIARQAVQAAPRAVLLVVTDPPDPLADVVRDAAGIGAAEAGRVISAGTFLDSLRFRVELAAALGVSPHAVQAQVLGEHGTSAVLHWSAASVGGAPVADAARQLGADMEALRERVDKAVHGANLDIIEGIGASQFSIGVATARLVEAVLRDERIVLPVGRLQPEGLTFSLPGVVGRDGVSAALPPSLTGAEREKLDRSIDALRHAAERLRRAG